MRNSIRVLAGVAAGAVLFFAWSTRVDAQSEIDAKIKTLQELEARIDAKLKRLDVLESRIEARLEGSPQLVTASNPPTYLNGSGINGSSAAALALGGAAAAASVPRGEEPIGNVVTFRGGYTHLNSPARSAVFTGNKTGTSGYMVGATVEVGLLRDPWFNNPLYGQVSMDFSGISGSTQFALGDRGKQSLYKIAVSPKYRIDTLGNWHPWIVPIGLSFLVNSPPSNATTYLTVGGTTGAGIEYTFLKKLSLGLAASYNFYTNRNSLNTDHVSVGPYIGVGF